MRKVALYFLFSVIASTLFAQEKEVIIGQFNKIILSPGIDLVLQQGEKEAVSIEFNGIESEKINAYVNKRTLKLYLDGAKMTPKYSKSKNEMYDYSGDIYSGAKVTAYVTYSYLNKLEIRGDNLVVAENEIESQKFKVVAYGENEIVLPSINAIKTKVVLYGENDFAVTSGRSIKQTFKSFGENKISTADFEGQKVKGKMYGEGRLTANASERLAVTAFGEAEVRNAGRGIIKRKIVIGNNDIRRKNSEVF
jgi:hypothetical protein